MISKETSRAEHEYMNKHPPPHLPINVLATALQLVAILGFSCSIRLDNNSNIAYLPNVLLVFVLSQTARLQIQDILAQ